MCYPRNSVPSPFKVNDSLTKNVAADLLQTLHYLYTLVNLMMGAGQKLWKENLGQKQKVVVLTFRGMLKVRTICLYFGGKT